MVMVSALACWLIYGCLQDAYQRSAALPDEPSIRLHLFCGGGRIGPTTLGL